MVRNHFDNLLKLIVQSSEGHIHRIIKLSLAFLLLITIIFFSYLKKSTGLPSDIDFFLNSGANKVLLKPLDLETFGHAMKDMKKL